MKRIAAAPFLVAAIVLAACAAPAPAGDAENGPWQAPEPPDEFASGLTVGAVPDGFAFEWNEGHETATFHVFTSADGTQVSIGRQLDPPPYPRAGADVVRNGRQFIVIADEVRILEELDDGVRVEVVSASLDVDSLLLIAESVSYDPSRDGSGPFVQDGELDCPTDYTWVEQGSVLEDTVGAPTSADALEEGLGPFLQKRGGEVVLIDQHLGSLVVDGREIVIAIASEAPAGGWIVLTFTTCEGFER